MEVDYAKIAEAVLAEVDAVLYAAADDDAKFENAEAEDSVDDFTAPAMKDAARNAVNKAAGFKFDFKTPGKKSGAPKNAADLNVDLAEHDRIKHHGYYNPSKSSCKYRQKMAKALNDIGATGGLKKEEISAMKEKIGAENWKEGARASNAEIKEQRIAPELQAIRNLTSLVNRERDPQEKARLKEELDAKREDYYRHALTTSEYESLEALSEMAETSAENAEKVFDVAKEISEDANNDEATRAAAEDLEYKTIDAIANEIRDQLTYEKANGDGTFSDNLKGKVATLKRMLDDYNKGGQDRLDPRGLVGEKDRDEEPEQTPEPQPEPTPEPTSEPPPEPQPEPTPEPTPEPPPEPQPEPTPEPTPEPKPEPKSNQTSGPTPTPNPQPENRSGSGARVIRPEPSASPNDPPVYKIGGKTYVDVSNLGFFRSMWESFKAGWRGQEVITAWDKQCGRWNKILEGFSEEQKDNIRGAVGGAADLVAKVRMEGDFNKAMAIDGLSERDKTAIASLKEQFAEAKNAKQRIAAWNALHKYLDDNGITSEGKSKEENYGTGGFEESVNRNATALDARPNTSIYKDLPPDATDDTYLRQMQAGILDQFSKRGIGARVVNAINGSSIIRYEVVRDDSTSTEKLEKALKDIALDLGCTMDYTPSQNEGKQMTGYITINQPKPKDAYLRKLLEKPGCSKEGADMSAPFLAGETADGTPIWMDLMDHGFLGGDSNSGKSYRIRGGLAGAFHVKSPKDLQVVVNAHANSFDYSDMADDPHVAGIGKNLDEVEENLKRGVDEWQRRKALFEKENVGTLKDYNKKMEQLGHPEKKLPQILIVTDEVTNLFNSRPQCKKYIRSILTNARKFGVAHLGATQDMRADNIPTDLKGAQRMGVQATNKTASQMIFDEHVPELQNLDRQGGLMVRKNGKIVRLRGTYVDGDNMERLVNYNKGNTPPPSNTPPPNNPPSA